MSVNDNDGQFMFQTDIFSSGVTNATFWLLYDLLAVVGYKVLEHKNVIHVQILASPLREQSNPVQRKYCAQKYYDLYE